MIIPETHMDLLSRTFADAFGIVIYAKMDYLHT